ncbi:DUF2793 domain-containing protein [Methylorubrum extorquens]|uniref:DUF2793 domain-containing protein n=1 Tax=Methylorubrum extorquens TaxID=408 RepID=UPI003CC9D8B9
MQLAVLDKDRAAPPASPAEGDRYLIVSGNPSGAWTGWSGRIARFQDGGWLSLKPLAAGRLMSPTRPNSTPSPARPGCRSARPSPP